MSKRRAEAQLTDRDDADRFGEELGEDDGKPWEKASAEQMAGRKIVTVRRKGQAQQPAPMEIPPMPTLPSSSSSSSVPAFSFTSVASTAASTSSSTPVFSFATESTKPEDVKVPAFTFPPVATPTFSFAPIQYLSEKKKDEKDEKESKDEKASPKKETEDKTTSSPVKTASPVKQAEEKKDTATFKPVANVDGIPAPAKPWPEFNFTMPASTPSSGEKKEGEKKVEWPSFGNPLQSPSFKFDTGTSLLNSTPFNFASFVANAASKKEGDDESGSDEDEDKTGVNAKKGKFGEDVEGVTGESEEPAVPANAPPPTLEKKTVATGEEGETTTFSVRGKLFQFEPAADGKPASWRERGTGTLKVNLNKETNKSRMVMRADTTLKVMLNAAVLPTLKVTKPAAKQISFGAINAETEDGSAPRLLQYLVRLGNPEDQAGLEKALTEAIPK